MTILVSSWLACGIWNVVKPLPAGTHIATLPVRLAESQIEYFDDGGGRDIAQLHQLAAIDHAEQLVVLDECPLTPELFEHLLARQRQRPNLKIVLVTDPRSAMYGGTAAHLLDALERSGIIVARTRLDRLRDSNPMYSSLWRLSLGWWSDPFDEISGETTLLSSLRRLNFKSDRRRVLVADDGAGGWSSMVMSGEPHGADAGIEIRGHLARDIAASELEIAAWSTDDDRLPAPPPLDGRSVGAIDARFLTEGAIRTALRDALAAAGSGDSISIVVREFTDRQLIGAALRAAARGAQLRLVFDPEIPANRAVAAEMRRSVAGNLAVRWRNGTTAGARFVLIRHVNDVWLNLGSADLSRRDLDDLNLEANIELHMPARAISARAAADSFARLWSKSAAYASFADESTDAYWRYRVSEATGLPMF